MSIQNARTTLPVMFGGGGATYADKVLGYSPILYMPLDETSGTTAICQIDTNQNGTYSGPTLAAAVGPFRGVAPSFDGVNDYMDFYSTAFNTAFNGQETTVLLWAKFGDWTDTGFFVRIRVDANNDIYWYQTPTDNQMDFYYAAGGLPKTTTIGSLSQTDWVCLAITASLAANQYKVFIEGSQEGSTVGSLGAWTGSLVSTHCVLGAVQNTGGSAWLGNLSHFQVYDRALTPSEIADLSSVAL